MRHILAAVLSLALSATSAPGIAEQPRSWTADNGDGTYTNPLFYDEFSDPDMIRVGDYYYLTGTTMHAMPGLPILRSRDLINWTFLGYAEPGLDLGPAYRLEGGDIYGQGIWAPSFRYHNGVFHIFTNVNKQATFHYQATDPAGPWTRTRMKRGFHDLSVLFDDDGKVYIVWGYQGLRMAELNADLTDIVPGTEREIIAPEQGMGEGAHITKVNGKYWITSAWFNDAMRMPVARADKPYGPYEVNRDISVGEDFGLAEGNRLSGKAPPFSIIPANDRVGGRNALHQGGYVQTPAGEWWGFSMMDYNSVGRLLGLSPVTWKDGWPYFGLPGNLGRTPRTWAKPATDASDPARPVYRRSDDFEAVRLQPVWQWNHVPVAGRWSLTERPGFLRLGTLPAADFWSARNSLTQRAIGPESRPRVLLDASRLKPGDIAGLALLNHPYARIGVERTAAGLAVSQFDERTGRTARATIEGTRIWLQADADFLTERAQFSFSRDGKAFQRLGDPMTMVFQLRTFQGIRYALFAYNQQGREGGDADFDRIEVEEPHPSGLFRPIPHGQEIQITEHGKSHGLSAHGGELHAGAPTALRVEARGLGRVALKAAGGYVTIDADGKARIAPRAADTAQQFQWIETPMGELALMSLQTNRFLRFDGQRLIADGAGPTPNKADGLHLEWRYAR